MRSISSALSGHSVRRELVPANLISVARPLIAFYGLVAFRYEPVLLVITLSVAFLTDVIDGNLARWYNRRLAPEDTSRFGGSIDLVADRLLQLGSLWVFFVYDMVPLWLPLLFSIKDVVFDTTRLWLDLRKGIPNDTLARYNEVHRWQTLIHGIFEAVLICGIPVFSRTITLMLGLATVGFGYFRGVTSIMYATRRGQASGAQSHST